MFQKNWENRKEVKTAWFACQYWRGEKVGVGGGHWREDNPKVNCLLEEKLSSERKRTFMNLDCVCNWLGSSRESFVPSNFVSWELINGKSIGSALDLHFLLGNTIIKCIYFLRTLVLSSWRICKVFSLWMCDCNTKLVFSGFGKTSGRSSGCGARGYQLGPLQMHCLLILVSWLLGVFKAFLPNS